MNLPSLPAVPDRVPPRAIPFLALAPALALALSALLASPPPAEAQQRITPSFSGGLAVGTSDLSEGTESGWLVSGGVEVPVGPPGLLVGLTGTHARIPFEGAFDEETQVTSAMVELGYLAREWSVSGLVAPYIRGGGGLQVREYDPGRLATNSTTHVGGTLTVGAGLRLLTEPAAGFLGARFEAARDAGYVGFLAGVSIPLG